MMEKWITKCPAPIRSGLRAACEDLYRIRAALLILLLYAMFAKIMFGEFCPMRILFGIPCPGCGMTRAAFCVLRLHFAEAWRWNPMVYVWIPALVFLLWKRYYFKRKSVISELTPVCACLVTLVFYIYQMAVCFPAREPYTYFSGNIIAWLKDAVAFFID